MNEAGYIKEIKASVKRLNQIVNNILDMTRLEAGALTPKQEWCEINEVIDRAIELAGHALDLYIVKVNIPENMPVAKIDPSLLEQALFNILLNVTQHTQVNTKICIVAKITNHLLEISITDNGKGLPDGDLERLFKPFVRGDSAPLGGSGLGLAIARGFIRIQNGDLVAEKPAEGGAKFIITIPAKLMEEK